ncbi:unnamed protein product [Acanthosepion pharaonis]|uniref:Uncharacterized protein n=1 Tax=Acanthosepion pharaonis TaxID=158019 RepID=A0A812EQV1_ACAPH|nr:unnamed protein product [Sepia pharaonis]
MTFHPSHPFNSLSFLHSLSFTLFLSLCVCVCLSFPSERFPCCFLQISPHTPSAAIALSGSFFSSLTIKILSLHLFPTSCHSRLSFLAYILFPILSLFHDFIFSSSSFPLPYNSLLRLQSFLSFFVTPSGRRLSPNLSLPPALTLNPSYPHPDRSPFIPGPPDIRVLFSTISRVRDTRARAKRRHYVRRRRQPGTPPHRLNHRPTTKKHSRRPLRAAAYHHYCRHQHPQQQLKRQVSGLV